MAVVIAAGLDKDVAGSPLFRGVSFKLERGDRMTLAGRNGAGKTTLLRMLSGETSIDGGELVLAKGTFNNLAQLESVLGAAERRQAEREAMGVVGV